MSVCVCYANYQESLVRRAHAIIGNKTIIPQECKKFVFPVDAFTDSKRAFDIIQMLNRQREIGPRDTRLTHLAVTRLLIIFGMGPRNTPPDERVRLQFFSKPFRATLKDSGRRRNNRGEKATIVDTAATDGVNIRIYRGIITSKRFERLPGHLGIERPEWVSHYAAVVLHEIGHVLHKRFQRRGHREVKRIMGDVSYPECFLNSKLFEDQNTWAEWFANTFSRSFILFAAQKYKTS